MRSLLLPIVLTTPVLAGGGKGADVEIPAPSRGGWEWSLSAGPAVRDVGTLRSSFGSRPALLPVVIAPPNEVPDIGSPNRIGDRTYDNGYVRADGSTPQSGFTTAWGYRSGSQVDGGELVYSATGYEYRSLSAPGIIGPRASERDDLSGFAPHIQLDGLSPWSVGSMRLGFSLGFDFTQVDEDARGGNLLGTQILDKFRVNYEDRYDLSETNLPAAPYAGAPDSNGPVLPNLPVSRTIDRLLVRSTTTSFSDELVSSLDLSVLSWTVGPSLHGTWGPWDLGLHGGLIANLYDWDAREEHTLTTTQNGRANTLTLNVDKRSDTEFEPGLYAQAEVSYRFSERLAITGFGRYDICDDIRMGVGVTSYELDPGGFTGGLMLKWLLP